MPNIMLTYRCNLNCPYCFANEFVNSSDCDITIENFSRAVEFAATTPGTHIGLIGGEPTIHPQLTLFIELLARNRNVETVMVYTNGLRLEPLLEVIQNPGVGPMIKILVNCNSPEVMGHRNFEQFERSLDLAFGPFHAGRQIKFGLNLYDNKFDYSFIKDLLVKYDQHQLRISLTVPDFGICGQMDPVEHFKSRKDYLLQFFREMDESGVLPYYDCNKPPRCIWTEAEWAWLCCYRNKYQGIASNLTDTVIRCNPVVDILPDLRAVRCFGMSEFEKVSLSDFNSITDLKEYFRNRIDAETFRLASGVDCIACYDRKVGRCAGGCLGYKQRKVEEVNQFICGL